MVGSPTRWAKVVPIKINIFAWKVCLDKLPTRLNLSLRGIDIPSIVCPNCSLAGESCSHLFFSCSMARLLWRKVARWWDFDIPEFSSYEEWITWFKSIRIPKAVKDVLEGVFYVMWWVIWKFRNQGDDGRHVLVLDSTVFHPQGGGQPADGGYITDVDCSRFKFLVQDVRSKNGIVHHYGVFERNAEELEEGFQVLLSVDESKRKLNSRLHSAGHLLDLCLEKVGLSHLDPSKGYHFPDGPYVEYKGTVPQSELQSKQKELESEANNLISRGGKVVSVGVYSYEEASELCGGGLPDYIPKESTPRVVKLGDFPGCPCGGTHVSDISDLVNIKVTQMRTKKGVTKVYYQIG
ncbi:alanine--tRNA ligase [Tanacetum coccineum]